MRSLPLSVRKIIARLEIEDQKIIDAASRRAADLQALAAEEFEALQELRRLAAADGRGKLLREERKDEDGKAFGWSDDNLADGVAEQIVKKVRDDARLDAASDTVAAIRQKKAMLGAAPQVARMTATRVKLELEKYSGTKFVEVERPRLAIGKNERLTDALSRLRETSLELIAERRTVQKAARTKSEAKAAADREIDKLADAGIPKTLAMFHGAGILWPRRTVGEGRHILDGLALVAFLLRDQLKAEISKLIDINANAFPDAMSREEQVERLAELDSEIDVAERLEAAAVEAVIAEGGVAHHRPDCSVLAVLSLRSE
ncbi:hypothetical protein [Bradyrhizobium sp. CCBAU 25338]|uniref:hypothetical protein n=1 Tax=Bradyrhizobium sp. CCBAU 25338 TaxID=1641877 RepID=UPI00230214DF|nr:hypothetical protein [Bradyrhizobium sp. CCBAU 25338]MDA9532813.1 hypothetical protein [Bradyrhizobium sp. CCBAU 25338]